MFCGSGLDVTFAEPAVSFHASSLATRGSCPGALSRRWRATGIAYVLVLLKGVEIDVACDAAAGGGVDRQTCFVCFSVVAHLFLTEASVSAKATLDAALLDQVLDCLFLLR